MAQEGCRAGLPDCLDDHHHLHNDHDLDQVHDQIYDHDHDGDGGDDEDEDEDDNDDDDPASSLPDARQGCLHLPSKLRPGSSQMSRVETPDFND